jgi:arginyl-tRNA synthetase
LTEFRNIYRWLGVRFDHDFFESECSEPSRKLVEEYRGSVFQDSNGALGADLASFGLGFCMVLKSDGAGLYATKDLALAKRKFDEFGVDQSIYVVDAAQTLHFKQVFKTLELMGYERAKHCVHIPYGQVVLPSGKMSSRTGTVIMFSQLKELLANDVYTNFLAKYDEKNSVAAAALAANAAQAAAAHEHVTPAAAAVTAASHVKLQKNQAAWSSEELARAQQAISVATIKYGMLNHDVAKDIVFVLEEWTARSGNTGVYMLYAYSRIQSIVREVKLASGDAAGKVDFSLLSHESERTLLLQMHDLWDVLERTVEQRNPSTLCNYLFDLSKSFSSWYEVPACSVNNAASEDLKVTRVEFVKSIAAVIKLGLNLLGIQTLERM